MDILVGCDYLKKIIDTKAPTNKQTLSYNTIWIHKQRDFQTVYIQKSKNKWLPKWELLGFEFITQDMSTDEENFLKQAQYLLDLDDDELLHIKKRLDAVRS